MRKHRLYVAAALATMLTAREAYGEPVIYHFKSPSMLETDKGSRLTLPPGYFLDEETWRERDEELRRLQALETRLVAENTSLRESQGDFPWLAVGIAGGLGVVVGILAMSLE